MKIDSKLLTLNEAKTTVDFKQLAIYSKMEKIVRKASTDNFSGKCLFVGQYDYNKAFYQEFGITQKQVDKAEKLIEKEGFELIKPFIMEGGDAWVLASFQNSKSKPSEELNLIVEAKFNGSSFNIPQIRFNLSTKGDRKGMTFANNSVGPFSNIDQFKALLDNVSDFIKKLL
jgi:hypothetical protein